VTGPTVGACECTMAYESVMGTGAIEYITDKDEKKLALHKILNHYKVNEGPDYHFQDQVVGHTAILKLNVGEITGKERIIDKE
ncbi:MAG: pyridoxamine 5'-phosphate oxidase family protein, partial [Clostridia bacterium]|nr:pyridoxamine 5'-phosphate oxidase family protein [Clostridia bacterium]